MIVMTCITEKRRNEAAEVLWSNGALGKEQALQTLIYESERAMSG